MKVNQAENKVIIEDDSIKNTLRGMFLLIVLILLVVVSEFCYRNLILLPFIVLIPAILSSCKWSYILLHRGITHKELCTFSQEGIVVPRYFKSDQLLTYRAIHHVRILATNPRFVDILIQSEEVTHPSKNLHLRLHYPFHKDLLQKNTQVCIDACTKFKLKYTIEERDDLVK